METFSSILASIRKQQTFLVATLLIGLSLLVGHSLYNSYAQQIEIYRNEELSILKAMVVNSVDEIDGDEYQMLLNETKKGVYSSAVYLKLKTKLHSIQKRNKLNSEVYTLSRLKNDSTLSLIVNSGDSVWFKNHYDAPKILSTKFLIGGAIGPYKDEHGTWLSAFTPIHNSNGKVVGSLHVDTRFDEFQKMAFASVSKEIIRAAIIYVLVLFLLLLITKYKIVNIRKFQNSFYKLSNEIRSKNEALVLAKATIEQRNKELSDANENLELGISNATSKLQAKNHELQLFFYHASHQMKTPITNILGLVELAKLEKYAPDIVEHLDKIGRLSKRTIRLLDQLNKASFYTPKNSFQNINLRHYIANSTNDNPYKNCVELSIEGPETTFKTNIYLIQVVFDAIFENAYFFSRKSKVEHAKIEVKYDIDDVGLRLEVKDNGCGISKDILSDVDKMFFVGSTLSKGNGLGLYLAKNAVEQLGGEMNINSIEGEFCSVDLFIPLSP
ncbi:MAG: HAMP domain-containing histidine kinase [Bacteroidia bacterium]